MVATLTRKCMEAVVTTNSTGVNTVWEIIRMVVDLVTDSTEPVVTTNSTGVNTVIKQVVLMVQEIL
jgi:hypothetical protein